jgi:hypothetical protein
MKISLLTCLLLLVAHVVRAQDAPFKTGHTSDILNVKFSPDDTQLISYSAGDGRLILWDVKTAYLLWMTRTEFIQKADERYNLQEFYWSEDGSSILTKSENGTYQTWDAKTGKILSVFEKPPSIVLKAEIARRISVTKDYQNFYLSDSESKENFTVRIFSRTGTVYGVSHDGDLFAEGGSWGNAAIKITELRTGKSWLLDGHLSRQRISSYQPNELEIRLTKEKEQRQAVLNEAKAQRDKQAAIDAEVFKKQVYITFEHYGDMTDPGEQRIMESGEPDKSKMKKSAADANAVWLRLHNDSPLPIEIPTQSMYLPNPKCFYEFPTGEKILGLCDDREISIWIGLENKDGKPIPYGFDFGSSAILLPKKSVLFAVPRGVLKNGNAIRFRFSFQKPDSRNKIEKYGTDKILRFRESELPKQ